MAGEDEIMGRINSLPLAHRCQEGTVGNTSVGIVCRSLEHNEIGSREKCYESLKEGMIGGGRGSALVEP